MKLIINQNEFAIASVEELRAELARVAEEDFAEVWLRPAADGASLCALINAESAWLMYLRHEGDPGFSTRNPEYSGAEDATIEYRLANGQLDRYPAAWAVSTKAALPALEHFFSTSERAPWLQWHE